MIVTTTNDLPGYRIVTVHGTVRGLAVRSRSLVGNIGGMLQSLFGGNIPIYTTLAEQARALAHDRLVAHAEALGANAVLAMRYDSNDILSGITEVLAYGTAVTVEPLG